MKENKKAMYEKGIGSDTGVFFCPDSKFIRKSKNNIDY